MKELPDRKRLITPKTRRSRERLTDDIFRRAGFLLSAAQTIEKTLAYSLYPSKLIAACPIDLEKVTSIKASLWTMTLGRLQKLCKEEFADNPELLDAIEAIRITRNRFIHDFFTKYSEIFRLPFATKEQLIEMLIELQNTQDEFMTFLHRLEALIVTQKPKHDAITKALYDFGKERGWLKLLNKGE